MNYLPFLASSLFPSHLPLSISAAPSGSRTEEEDICCPILNRLVTQDSCQAELSLYLCAATSFSGGLLFSCLDDITGSC